MGHHGDRVGFAPLLKWPHFLYKKMGGDSSNHDLFTNEMILQVKRWWFRSWEFCLHLFGTSKPICYPLVTLLNLGGVAL